MKKIIICTIIFIELIGSAIFGQTKRKTPPKPKTSPQPVQTIVPTPTATPVPTPTPVSLDTILTESAKQIENYRVTFKDLLANETKTFQSFDKEGNPKKETVVESDFLVYQSAKDEKVTTELRNVVKVDGKPVPDAQSRSQRLLTEVQKSNTVEKELEKIQSEGARYDKTLDIGGLTLFEGGVLLPDLRPYFDFEKAGEENYQGSDVYVINYRQTKKSPFVMVNGSDKDEEMNNPVFSFRFDVPDEYKNTDIFLNGKLWIDKQTYQIRREEREVTIQSSTPIIALSTEFDYQQSDYGILVPKQIMLMSNKIKRDKETDQYRAVQDVKVTYAYSKFRKINTDVKVIDEN